MIIAYRYFFVLILTFLSIVGFCQPVQWKGITKSMDFPPYDMGTDSSTNTLLLTNGPKFIYNGKYYYCATWDGVQFDSLAPYIDKHLVLSIVKYKNDYYANTQDKIIRKSGTHSWTTIGTFKWGYASGMCIYNNNLVVYGGFDSISNIPASCIAKYDGTNWNAFDTTHFYTSIETAEEFQGYLYIGGNMVAKNGWCHNLGMYNGTTFVNVDNNIMAGSASAVMRMKTYKGALYMSGGFNKASGKPANRFVKWDGINWDTLGGGFTGSAAIADMTIYKNELYCIGSFTSVAGIYSPHMFKFDGSTIYGGNVCSFDNTSLWLSIHPYNDTLYVSGGFEKICNDSAHYVAKWLGDASSFTNSVSVVGVNEFKKQENQIKIYPNPTQNILHIETNQYFESGTEIEITNTLGQTVLKLPYNSEIDVSSISNGCYILQITSNNNPKLYSKFVKQ